MPHNIRWHQRLFGIDYRSLAIFRVGLALGIFGVLWSFFSYDGVSAFLSDDGIYPRELAMRSRSDSYWSLYFLQGGSLFSIALLILTGISAAALLVGYYTRIATIACWILIASLMNRTPILLQGGDFQLCVMLFWAMFLPLGGRWSVDASLRPQPTDTLYCSIASAAILLQVLYLYLGNGLHKVGPEWFPDGSAIYYALNFLEVTSILSPYLAEYYDLTKWLTYYVYVLELLAPLLLFAPVFIKLARKIILLQLILLHLGFVIFLNVGMFPLISLAGLMVFMPTDFWTWLAKKTGSQKRQGIQIWYDQDCKFCYKVCRIFREFSLPRSTPILAAQSSKETRRIFEKENSWVVTDHLGNHHTRWDAVAYLWRRSPVLWPLGLLFRPKFMLILGDVLYKFIAVNRYKLGVLTKRLLVERDQPATFRSSWGTKIFLLLCMSVVLAWNISDFPQVRNSSWAFSINGVTRDFVIFTRLPQKWNMFAPAPSKFRRWHVVEGVLNNGKKVDLLYSRDRPARHAEAKSGYSANPTYRWRKFFSRASQKTWTRHGELINHRFGQYFCQRWNERLGKKTLRKVKAYRYWYYTTAFGKAKNKKNTYKMLDYSCKS